jgi:hypothetical protein
MDRPPSLSEWKTRPTSKIEVMFEFVAGVENKF